MLSELKLELKQSHMAQKPVLQGEGGCACLVNPAINCHEFADAIG